MSFILKLSVVLIIHCRALRVSFLFSSFPAEIFFAWKAAAQLKIFSAGRQMKSGPLVGISSREQTNFTVFGIFQKIFSGPAVLTDGLEEIPTFSRDFFT